MPKRTNKFQQLVFLLQRQLGACSVEESAMLKDRQTGDEAEVDIAVTNELHGIEVIVGFECRDTGRRIDRTHVQQLVQKHLHLTDKLVIVSSKGFTKTALKLCAINRAEAITFANADGVDWKGYVDEFSNLTFGLFDLTWTSPPVIRYTRITPVERPLKDDADTLVLWRSGKSLLFRDALGMLCRSGVLGRKIMDQWFATETTARLKQYEVTATFTPDADDPWLLVQESEHAYSVDSLDLRVGVKASQEKLSMSPMLFMDKRVLEGTVTMTGGEYAGKPIQFLISEADGGKRRGSVLFPALPNESGPKIHEAELAE